MVLGAVVRTSVGRLTGDPARFDAVVLHGLVRIGFGDVELEWNEALRRRRHFGRALAALIAVADERDPAIVDVILAAFAGHGIHRDMSNRELRDLARGRPGAAPVAGR